MTVTRLLGRQQFSESSDPSVRRNAVQLERQRAFLALYRALSTT